MSAPIRERQLFFDSENPRNPPTGSQIEAVQALIQEQGKRLVDLTRDIGRNGANPAESLIVVKESGKFIVLEGNRRLAAVRLLMNPGLASGTKFENDYKRIAKDARVIPSEFECWVARSREEAREWIKLRHTSRAGVGVVAWSPRQQQRFDFRPGTQAGKASVFLDVMANAFPLNAALQEDLKTISADRLTTLGRLVADPDFRRRFGLEESGEGRYSSHYPVELLEDAVERLARDLATTLSVTRLKVKKQRLDYLKGLPTPGEEAWREEAQPLVQGTSPMLAKKPRKPLRPRPGPIFKDLAFSRKMGPRIPLVLQELKDLDLDKFPNAAGILCRAILELAVDHFYTKRTWRIGNEELRNKVKRCLHEIDATDRDDRFQAVRSGLTDGTSTYAVKTLHAFVHNEHYHPTATEVRAFSANYEPFLAALDALA